MKKIEDILNETDRLFEENNIAGVEVLLTESLRESEAAGDLGLKLQILNELIGFYRQLSRKEELQKVIDATLDTLNDLNLSAGTAYATSLLNIATGYRSMGELEMALGYYDKTEAIYQNDLASDDLLWANFYNNKSLLFQEKGDYANAEDCLLRALDIVVAKEAGFEIAVTYANLANTAVMAKKYINAKTYAVKSMQCFEERGTIDPHYCAALTALGMCYLQEDNKEKAEATFKRALEITEMCVGRNAQYRRIEEYLKLCGGKPEMKGLEICRKYYEAYGRPMIEEKFAAYKDKIAVGLVGKGSDCFGYDDESSRDHDWGPGFIMWVSKETYGEIGEALQSAYNELPSEFEGYVRAKTVSGTKRRGVLTIDEFYENLLGTSEYEKIDWTAVEDYNLACAVNGEVFVDNEGIFSAMRGKLMLGYPEHILYLKIADDAAKFSQTGQYNYSRVLNRGDKVTALVMLSQCLMNAMKLAHHMNNMYPPHDKWLYKSTGLLPEGEAICEYLNRISASTGDTAINLIEGLAAFFAEELYARDIISDTESYLDFHTDELVKKSSYARLSTKELVDKIARTEFEAFDKVKNEGGRASCQNDWLTFSAMRKSQYMTWDRTMLLQYLYDFITELSIGHNLITEKYGRMEESTAPDRYENLKSAFPPISEEKKAVIEQIVAVQMEMADAFEAEYPNITGNARSLHTYDDNFNNTSYETYLRGEISTYSDKMLQLYGRFVIMAAREGKNIARMTIENTAKLYGYSTIEELETKI